MDLSVVSLILGCMMSVVKPSVIWNYIPSGYDQHSHGTSPFFIGKPSINGPSIPWLC